MQRDLDLGEGWHVGPLFIAAKVRAPKLRSAFDGSRRIWGMLRRGAERRATPKWADTGLTRDLFKLAAIYTKALGVRHSVDHAVPLTHPLVCGLHAPDNLFPGLLVDNISKGNSWWPDMPEQQMELL